MMTPLKNVETGCLRAVAMHQISPVAPLPVVLGGGRKLHVAGLIATCCPPHPAHVLSCGRGVEALLLAMLDGHHALSQVGRRLEERGRFPLLQPGLNRTALQADRLGQSLEALVAAHRNGVFGALALNALAVSALATPWRHQDPTTLTLSGASAEQARPAQAPVPPRPASGPSQDGPEDRQQVRLRLGGSRDGLPLRLGVRDGQTRDSPETPVALEEWVALGRDGVRGLVAARKASGQRTRGWCREQRVGLLTLVPRPGAVRQEVATWGQQQGALPLWLAKPGRTRQEPPRRWHGHSVTRPVAVAYADGRLAVEAIRFLVVHSSQLAQQAASAATAAHTQEAHRSAEPLQRVAARWLAWAADAEAASPDEAGRGPGRRGRTPRLWRSHTRHDRVEAVTSPTKRLRRGRPSKAEASQGEGR